MAPPRRWLFLLFAIIYAIGYALIGAYHGSARALEDGSFVLHVVGGSLAAICGNLAIATAGLSAHRLRPSPGFRRFCLATSAFSVLALTMLVIDKSSPAINLLADGVWERGGCYAIIVWELIAGVLLLRVGRS